MTKTVTNNQPSQTNSETVAAEPSKVQAIGQRRNSAIDAFDTFNARKSETLNNKASWLNEADSAIAAVIAITGDAENDAELASKVAEASVKASFVLYQGMTSGVATYEEVSELLGRQFGWRRKQNGEQSKTPHGQGETIRKRVRRASDAKAFVLGAEPKALFAPLEREAVAAMVASVDAGERSVFTLYDDLAKMKADATGTRPAPAFDPKRIAALAAALGADVAASVELMHKTPGLFEAYAGLSRIMRNVSAEYGIAHPDVLAA